MIQILAVTALLTGAYANVAWSPIFVDGNSQVDLWTQEAHGCRCSFDAKRQDCACCAKDGGCPCGRASPHRCTQCGLEDYCANPCNMTIDSRVLSARSGKSFGQIKSPSVEGPGSCQYTLQPAAGQRVELQIYRIVSVGRFNGSGCSGGYLGIREGLERKLRSSDIQICGVNERYTPPIVVFTDRPTSLLFVILEATARSQFLAYFSFTQSAGSLGSQLKGGRKTNQSDCEWLFQDVACRSANSCVVTSPGYPGLYPPRRLCKYHITTSSMHTRVKITFSSIHLAPARCKTDYIAVYQGSSSSNPLIQRICNKTIAEFIFTGPNLLMEFSSGSSVPPFDYNGFRASLDFSEKTSTTESSINYVSRTTETGILSTFLEGTSAPRIVLPKSNCDMIFTGNQTRSGTFDTRTRVWAQVCSFTFIGKLSDIVHISLFNYVLKATSCQSSIEVYDGLADEGRKPSLKLCSPVKKHARDMTTGKFLEHQHFVSKENRLTVVLKRVFPSPFQEDTEFIDGAFMFHDENVDGTLEPSTLCDVQYYGLSSAPHGQVGNPGSQDLFFNIERTLKCAQRFDPAANQSITLTVNSYSSNTKDSQCVTMCGDVGCTCVPKQGTLQQTDHLLVETDDGHLLQCICGDYQEEWLPITLRSWSAIKLVYYVAHYTWERKGFNFSANFTFMTDPACGHQTLTTQSGEIEIVQVTPNPHLNVYYYPHCTWMLDTKVERQLSIELYTAQDRRCTAWNITIHEYNEDEIDRAGAGLYTFCPRDGKANYEMDWRSGPVVVRLQGLTSLLPEFTMKWDALVGRPNTRSDPQTPKNNVSTIQANLSLFFMVIFIIVT